MGWLKGNERQFRRMLNGHEPDLATWRFLLAFRCVGMPWNAVREALGVG